MSLSQTYLSRKQLLADNLDAMGVSGYSSNDGLTTLINAVLDIPTGGSCYHIEFSEASYTAFGGVATLEVLLQENYSPKANATVAVTGSDGSVYSGITNTDGVATFNVSVTNETSFTASYSNVTDTCTVNVPSIPSQYIQVEYLQSDGNNGINTGYILKANDIVEVTFSSQATASYESIFGARKQNNDYNSYVLFCRFAYSHKMNYGRTRSETKGQTIQTNTIYTAVTNQRVCTVYNENGTVNQTINNTAGTIEDCINPCGLFTLNTANGTDYTKDTQSHMKIYSFKITDENGNFKRYMLPVRDGTTGGMYDLISQQFYTDASEVTFLYGADI